MGDNMGGNMGDNTGDNTGDNIINITEKRTGTILRKREEEEDLSATPVRAAAERAWKHCFGTGATPEAIAYVTRVAQSCEMSGNMVALAIRNAAIRMAESPAEYAATLLADWDRHDVTDPARAAEYEAERAAERR